MQEKGQNKQQNQNVGSGKIRVYKYVLDSINYDLNYKKKQFINMDTQKSAENQQIKKKKQRFEKTNLQNKRVIPYQVNQVRRTQRMDAQDASIGQLMYPFNLSNQANIPQISSQQMVAQMEFQKQKLNDQQKPIMTKFEQRNQQQCKLWRYQKNKSRQGDKIQQVKINTQSKIMIQNIQQCESQEESDFGSQQSQNQDQNAKIKIEYQKDKAKIKSLRYRKIGVYIKRQLLKMGEGPILLKDLLARIQKKYQNDLLEIQNQVERHKREQSIKRRTYQCLSVLSAVGVVDKTKKKIISVKSDGPSRKAFKEVKKEWLSKVQNKEINLKYKRQLLYDLITYKRIIHTLMTRNRQPSPTSYTKFIFPFMTPIIGYRNGMTVQLLRQKPTDNCINFIRIRTKKFLYHVNQVQLIGLFRRILPLSPAQPYISKMNSEISQTIRQGYKTSIQIQDQYEKNKAIKRRIRRKALKKLEKQKKKEKQREDILKQEQVKKQPQIQENYNRLNQNEKQKNLNKRSQMIPVKIENQQQIQNNINDLKQKEMISKFGHRNIIKSEQKIDQEKQTQRKEMSRDEKLAAVIQDYKKKGITARTLDQLTVQEVLNLDVPMQTKRSFLIRRQFLLKQKRENQKNEDKNQ